MAELADLGKNLTYKLELPGGQGRLKMLWRADFSSFLARRFPITGRPYQKLEHGPAPVEMKPILRDLERDGAIKYVLSDVPNEQRPVPTEHVKLVNLSPRDLGFLDEAINHYRDMTAKATSKDSHGVAWRTREFGAQIPYEAAIFDDRPLPQELEQKLIWLGRERHWRSA
jgi:hypothetical protein